MRNKKRASGLFGNWKEMLKPLECEALSKLCGIEHGFFTREGGVSCGVYSSLNGSLSQDRKEAVLENRRLVGKHLGSKEERVFIPDLCHSARAVFVDEECARRGGEAGMGLSGDGIVTRTRKVGIGVVGADCVPVLFADAEGGVIGAAHAGWRGAQGGVLEATVELMKEHGARVERIVAGIGPCIRQRNYEVGREFMEKFVGEDEGNEGLFRVFETGGREHFDLAGYVGKRLDGLGIGEWEDLEVCTKADERFFSYRRTCASGEEGFGCQMSAIMLK